MTEHYPLNWPPFRERTQGPWRRKANFKTTQARARDELLRQLNLLNATDIVISSNVATYTRGGQVFMYADQIAASQDPGVAVYYKWRNEQYALACDQWTTVTDNLQALNKTVEAIRGIERWGTGEMMKAAFSGFKALPVSEPVQKWYEVLGLTWSANKDQVREAYRRLAMIHHPDKGGSAVMFQKIKNAYDTGINL